jgi:hypothetical protein
LRKIQKRKERRARKEKSVWVKGWLSRREHFGQYHKLMRELENEDVRTFKNMLRMEPAMFKELLQRVCPRIEKSNTFWRKPLEPGLRLALTLRFLATGNCYRTLSFGYRVAHNTICNMIAPVCEAIIAEYADELFSLPVNEEQWLKVAELYEKRWNLPHCVGAIDGKHIAIRKPSQSGSLYFNYKHFYSIVLLAIVDADYKFMYIDVGANGAGSDGGIFAQTDVRELFEDGTIGLPPPSPLPGTSGPPVGYFLVGDEAFPLRTWLMKPIPRRNLDEAQRIYNYRISRARRVVENAFGILVSR